MSSRASASCIFFFFFFFFFNFSESISCSFWLDSHCVDVVEVNRGSCRDGSVSGLDVRLHMPPWHQSSSWLSRWDGTHSLSLTFSTSSLSLFRFFFFFFRFFSLADSTRLAGVAVAGDAIGSVSASTSECRLFFFFFFFWLAFRGLLRSGSWAEELRLLEDLGFFGPVLCTPLVLRERLAFGFCSVERRDCCLKDPLEWAKGCDDWTLGEWNGPALGRKTRDNTWINWAHLYSEHNIMCGVRCRVPTCGCE